MLNKNVALVLSGGGARGLAHIGVIEELEKRGYQITSVAGTSMGALVGGIYATGKLSLFKEWMCTLDKRKVFDLVDFNVGGGGVIKGIKIMNQLKKMIPDRQIEDLDIPFSAVAVDILHDKEIVFSNGDLYDIIRASIAIPTVFIPVKMGDMQLVDGGVLNPIPINRVHRTAGDILIAVDVNAHIPQEPQVNLHEPPKKEENNGYRKYFNLVQSHLDHTIPKSKNDPVGYFNLINKSINLMTHQISQLTIEKFPPDILFSVSKDSFQLYEFYKAREIIQEGAMAVQKVLD